MFDVNGNKNGNIFKGRTGRCLSALFGGVVLLSLLSGCAFETRSDFSRAPITLHNGIEQKDIGAAQLQEGDIAQIAAHYKRYGSAPLKISVAYDRQSEVNTALEASDALGEIVTKLESRGVYNVQADIIPVQALGDDMRVLISYSTVTAAVPTDCTEMGGIGEKDVGVDLGYKYGCSITSQLARQVYRPQDLNGNDAYPADHSARRAADTTVNYKYAIPNQPLEGESVTTLGE